jgi:hypothetical protein
MINTKLQSIINTKSAIGNAIVNKGGTITSETPFFNYAAQIDGISTGTPQTIFAASDGSKWALTNVVNLTNVSNNVTYDFNRWQPANNSTSDPILNVGTVGANISGNIQLVPVNQVNIAQYENIVINDTTGAKYVGYNGYDSQTNPTPTGNTTFNRWLLNNSATGTVIFANTTIVNGGTFNGPNTVINEASMPFVNNTASYGGGILSVTINNGFIYVGGFIGGFPSSNSTTKKFYESNLAFVDNTAVYGGEVRTIATNNGFIYAGGSTVNHIKKYHESNLVFNNNSVSYGAQINNLVINNGFIYVGGVTINTVRRYNESTLAFVNNTASYGSPIQSIAIKDGFVYVGGDSGTSGVRKYHESNLAFISNTSSYGGTIHGIAVNNGFVYVGGETNQTVRKFHASNLAFVGNTVGYGGDIREITTNNGFIYVGGAGTNQVKKYYESNLALLGNTASYGGLILSVTTNNGFIYAGGDPNQTVKKFQETGTTLDTLTFYTATKIKE